ncbi:DUF6377 domain-containing protein [uncultured Bacteroides sp.]|uniref:DUF6377 domain-containing protein n=1 Tax=uncultured Bacteroides sp. TaxID=162156 RepID=UPI0025FA2486|nr:DUF6377 domain-containing protein [uncultured Bacteroides sp.]
MKPDYSYLKKRFLFLLVALSIGCTLCADNGLKQLTDSLRRMIDEKPAFVQKKEERINRIKCLLKASDLTLEREYRINLQLYDEYKKFVIDSAIHYVDRNLEIAHKLNRPYWKYQTSLQLSLLYSMCGRYRDAELILENIKTAELPRRLLPAYYETYSRFWGYYSITATKDRYGQQREAYQDSLIALLDHSSFDYKLSRAYYYGSRDSIEAKKILQGLLETEEVGTPNYAMITHAYASFCWYQQKYEERKKYLMMSAIADIKNATRETASLQSLALIQYDEKNLADAFKFTQSAFDDVVSSGIHFRAMEIYKFYSIINTAYQADQAKSKSNLVTFLISTSIILFLLILLVICIYAQMKKILKIKRALAQSNEKLLGLNDKLNNMNSQLNDTNNQLCEINNVKEHYIAEFFDVCFSYINKMEKYQNMLYKIAINKYYEELIKKLKSSVLIDEELSALYTRFDKVFLNLYPTFVSDFNALLKKEEQIVLKPGALLSRELRIYALLRLGITDSGRIANFLRCSNSTVYNYRTKMRNKAAVDRDEFENEIMKISSTQDRIS